MYSKAGKPQYQAPVFQNLVEPITRGRSQTEPGWSLKTIWFLSQEIPNQQQKKVGKLLKTTVFSFFFTHGKSSHFPKVVSDEQ